MRPIRPRSWFTRLTKATAHAAGHAPTFVVALLLIVIWAATGRLFKFSNTWQLVVNTATTIVTFLMVFLILLDLEELEEKDLDHMRKSYVDLARQARQLRPQR